MTHETIDLIIEWFGHIQQMATDRKTQTGAVMDAQHCLNEIAAIASDSKQFVKEYRYEQEPLDEEKLDELAKEYADKYAIPNTFQHTTMEAAYKNGYKQAWEDKK